MVVFSHNLLCGLDIELKSLTRNGRHKEFPEKKVKGNGTSYQILCKNEVKWVCEKDLCHCVQRLKPCGCEMIRFTGEQCFHRHWSLSSITNVF